MKRGSNTFKIALGGIFLALTMVCLFAASIVPGIELTLFACSSFFTAFMILESGVGGAVLLFAAASLLGLIILPNKLAMIPFIFLFGYYGILKFFKEKIPGTIPQLACKVCFFAAVLSVGILGFMDLVSGGIHLPEAPAALLVIGGTLLMLLYDFIYSFVISFYIRRIQRKGIDEFKLS